MKVTSNHAAYTSLPRTLSHALRLQLIVCRALHFAAQSSALRVLA